jgi:hypothetical protein
MSTIAINYIVNPFSNFFKTFQYAFEVAGMARAATELRRMGYEKEYQIIMKQIREITKNS